MSLVSVRSICRAAFVGMSATLLIGASPSPSIEGRLLDAHNRERAALNLPPLQWDSKLSADAQRWASHLAKTGRFEHYREQPGDQPQGENLWAGTRGFFSPEDMVGLWIEEKRHYRAGRFPNNSKTGRMEDVGHYTQLIWADTRRLGCAIAAGGKDEILVCRYSAPGNIVGQTPA